jgi:hypothetical protein
MDCLLVRLEGTEEQRTADLNKSKQKILIPTLIIKKIIFPNIFLTCAVEIQTGEIWLGHTGPNRA